jgi:hypothetical protein
VAVSPGGDRFGTPVAAFLNVTAPADPLIGTLPVPSDPTPPLFGAGRHEKGPASLKATGPLLALLVVGAYRRSHRLADYQPLHPS